VSVQELAKKNHVFGVPRPMEPISYHVQGGKKTVFFCLFF